MKTNQFAQVALLLWVVTIAVFVWFFIRGSTIAGTADVNPALMAKLPLEFKALGMGVHHEMDEIAKAAEDGKPAAELLKMTSNTLTKCVACHAAWQLKAGS